MGSPGWPPLRRHPPIAVLKVRFQTSSTWELGRNSNPQQPLPLIYESETLEVEPSNQCFNKLSTLAALLESWECVVGIFGEFKKYIRDFPGGTVVKNPPAYARDTGLSPGPGRSHMPWSN